jgi:ribosomal protein L40E
MASVDDDNAPPPSEGDEPGSLTGDFVQAISGMARVTAKSVARAPARDKDLRKCGTSGVRTARKSEDAGSSQVFTALDQ